MATRTVYPASANLAPPALAVIQGEEFETDVYGDMAAGADMWVWFHHPPPSACTSVAESV